MDAVTQVPVPVNETVLDYAPGSPERASLEVALAELGSSSVDLPHTIAGKRVMGTRQEDRGPPAARPPQGARHDAQRDPRRRPGGGRRGQGGRTRAGARLSFDDRAAILLKAAELLSGPWRAHLNAATMLGQSKTAYQAEIDAACELIDFWRINVHFARQILAEQPPLNAKGIWNRTDHRPLEGFVYAITPFNFTAIAGNLPTAPALMGNTVVWKPSPTQQFAAQLTMALLEEAGMPPGVINMVTGDGLNVSKVALADPDLAGIHFTGSTPTFQHLWQEVGANLPNYRTYPRLVGETGGKDFILAHPSADPDVLRTAMIRGAFEYQGQKCSAASRAYVPRSLWKKIKADLVVDHQRPQPGRRHRPVQLHGRRHRRARLRQAHRGHRPRARQRRASRWWPVAPTTTARAGSSARPSSRSTTRPTSRSAPSTSARSCRSTSTRTASTTRCSTRWSRSRRTA